MEEMLVEYLYQNCKGYDNKKKAYQLMKIISIKDHKTFRNIIENIRQADNEIFICSQAGKDGGYWIPTEKWEIEETVGHLRKRAYEMLKTADRLEKKAQKEMKHERGIPKIYKGIFKNISIKNMQRKKDR